MAVIAAEHPPERAEFVGRVLPALKDASITALVALGLVVPILALRIDQDINNQPILRGRWHYVAVAVGLAFAARLGYLLIGPWATACALLSAALTYQHTVSPLLGAPWDYLVIAAGWLATGYAARRWLNPPAPEPTAAKPAPGGVLPAGFAQVAAIVGIVLLVLYPLAILALTGRSGAIKWIDNFGIQILIYVMLGWGLNIVVGLAGLLDLGYVAFYAVGAYSTALLSQHFGFSFWLCLPLAGIFAALWGIMLGFPVLRLRGDYLAIVTLAFGEIIRLVLINWVPVTNGYAGISGIPRPSFFGLPFNASDTGFAAVMGLEFSPLHRTIFLFYVILALALLTNWVTLRLRRLPVGRAWEALREDEIACRSLGINTTSTKLTAFAIGAGFGGFAGSFFAARQGFISPESFTFIESAVVVAIVVLGGMGSQLGVAIAAAAMIGGTEVLRELDWLKQVFGPDFDPTQYRMLLFGFGMVAVMIWKPRGLISTRSPSIFLRERRAVGASLVKEGHG